MKIINKLGVIFIFFLFFPLFSVSASNNTHVYFHSLESQNYAVKRCTVSGQCVYFNHTTHVELMNNSDWIIKIVPYNYSIDHVKADIYQASFPKYKYFIGAIISFYILVLLYKRMAEGSR